MDSASTRSEGSATDLSLDAAEVEPLIALVRGAAAKGSAALQTFAPDFDDPKRSIRLADAFRALRELTLIVREETFQLSARPMITGTAELVFGRAAGCETVGQAMREIAHTYNLLHGGDYNQVEQRGATLTYVLNDESFPYT